MANPLWIGATTKTMRLLAAILAKQKLPAVATLAAHSINAGLKTIRHRR